MDIFYQKYRPRKIAELDLESARKTLSQILSQENLPHAFLFSGPKGIGKTSSARVLAKSLNCPETKKGEPCGKCDICREIDRGESLDVIEIDAASNRGIDDIRELKEKINLRPLKARRKVYIIDEVHMLTKEAFNAILKTLEEPPDHVYFIFCTTDPEKIPETVLSRLTRVEFNRASIKEIVAALSRVVEGEKIKTDEKILSMIAQTADGSFRDAHKIFYQLWLEGQGKLSLDLAKEILGRWQESNPRHFLSLMMESKTKEAILLLEKLNDRGINWQDYGRRLLFTIQRLLMDQVLGEQTKEGFSYQQLLSLGDLFNEAILQAKSSPIPQLPFQLAVVGYSEKQDPVLDQKRVEEKPAEEPTQKPKNPGKTPAFSLLEEKWADLLELVKPMNHSVCALLRACRPKQLEDNCLILEVFYRFHKDQLEQERNRQIIEEALEKLFSAPFRIRCQLGERPKTPPPPKLQTSTPSAPPDSGGEDLYEVAKEIFGE